MNVNVKINSFCVAILLWSLWWRFSRLGPETSSKPGQNSTNRCVDCALLLRLNLSCADERDIDRAGGGKLIKGFGDGEWRGYTATIADG